MDYKSLSDLIKTNPAYATATDAELAAWVNAEVVTNDKATLSSGEVFATIASNIADFNALTDAEKQTVRDILYIHSGEGIPTSPGSPARSLLVSIFGGSSNTIQALAAQLSETVSRAVDAGLIGDIGEADIAEAKRRYD